MQYPIYNILSNFSSNIMTSQIKIGHYTLGKTIGQGGFAKVKVGKHDITGLQVAVKIINKKKMKNKNMISKVKRQIQILKLITHPNIIKLYEVLDTTNDIFVIMELGSKGQLYQYFFDKPCNEVEVCYYFKQIINGLQYIHRNRIAHRDLKPQNILIDANNLIKIGDFGLSNIMKDGKLLKSFCGSLSYAAPQIINQNKYEGSSIDIWSCGVILFLLLTKKFPFEDEIVTRLYKKMEYGLYQIPFQLSPMVKDLIKRMLQFDPRNRISLQQMKVHPWLKTQIPIYLRIPQESLLQKERKSQQIDNQVLQQVKSLNLNFKGYTQQKIKKVISDKHNQSFVIAYQLLKTQKDKKNYQKKIQQSNMTDFTIFKNIKNGVKNEKGKAQMIPNNDKFLYGRIFNKSPKFLAEKIMQFLRNKNIEYQIRSQQYSIKCCYQILKEEPDTYQMTEQTEQEQQEGKKQGKFSMSILKFTIQIYEVNRKNQVHMVDIQLNQGHPFIFFPLARKIYSQINQIQFQ